MLATAKSPFTKWLSWILLSRFHSLYHIPTHTQRSEAHPGQWLPSVSRPETLSSSFIRVVNIQAVMALIVRCENEKKNVCLALFKCSYRWRGCGCVSVCVVLKSVCMCASGFGSKLHSVFCCWGCLGDSIILFQSDGNCTKSKTVTRVFDISYCLNKNTLNDSSEGKKTAPGFVLLQSIHTWINWI